ncbi:MULTISPECIES: Zn-ribbon domain-containing OB-fold protein [unclassified Bradyrhizobium]|uniref:Zn-ribbon domain-containing OB-fold protein n=1 Tax=unclassified Bradyrhizobium TaxID=2631580 RepID=UPI002342AA1D|nr:MULTISPECIES: OB-fold domain-containing protein [unclassified Bradyrhizobium]GLH77157.1 hypothetical protein SSBR45G_20650 [Bradyrhizobium sp. SSBR45G]GLH83915.1 hypothetical protein SSBR45R_13750 [Bradyrhizobium sp. SSBR45R]
MTTMYQDRPLGLAVHDPATAPFFAATAVGAFRVKVCVSCRKPHWYPRPLCPYCLGDTEWSDVTGKGEIYSVSVTRRAGPTPYAIAYVRLDEGITMLSNIVDCNLDSLRIGQRVRVVFKPAEDGTMIPMFVPDQG